MPTQAAAIQRQMQLRATERLLKSGDWLSAEDVARLGLRSSRNAKALAHRWAKKGLLFAIRHEGRSLYPAYALDPETGYRPRASFKAILDAFNGDNLNGWTMAFWFNCPNSYLADRLPKDCLDKLHDEVILAAKRERLGIQHG